MYVQACKKRNIDRCRQVAVIGKCDMMLLSYLKYACILLF